MRGHVARQDDRYYVVIDQGIDPRTGKRRRTWHAAGKSRRAAERMLAELLEQKRTDTYVEPSRLNLAQYLLTEWLPLAQAELRHSTFDSYRRNADLHVVPRIGSLPLQKVRPIDLTKLYAELLRNGRQDGKGGLAPKTVHNIHQMLRKSFADAVQLNYVVRNAAASAKVPKPLGSRRREMKYWTADELRLFLEVNRDSYHWPAWYVGANTGMRRGEILGLRWRDVDFDVRRLAIRHTIISVAYELRSSDAKTDRSERVIDLDARTTDVLRHHHDRQVAYRRDLVTGYETNDLVFPKPDGRPVHPDIFSNAFDRRIQRTDVPRIRLHDLRHTHATLLLRAGVQPKVVSERLGHASVAFTMHVYAHVLPGMQAEAASAFGDLVFGDVDDRQNADDD
jgi:integrase